MGRIWALAIVAALACGGGEPVEQASAAVTELAILRLRDGGEIRVRLLRDAAPGHVDNFARLAREGFYDGTTFHRVIPGFMIQGGDPLSRDADPTNDGTGGPGWTIPAEASDVPHRRGTLSMARRSDPDSAGSQFFIVVADSSSWRDVLDGKYTAFGEVVAGMDVADRIVSVERDLHDRPLADQVIESIRIAELPLAAREDPP